MPFQEEILHLSTQANLELKKQDFDFKVWLKRPGVSELRGGRGGTLKVTIQNQVLVLHRYLRGGLIAKFLNDRYFWTGMAGSRPYQEMKVVDHAQQYQLPVAEMLGFYIKRQGLFYRAANINRFIENQGSVADYISVKPLDSESWKLLGQLIRRMHQAGINHADLNANNILVDQSGHFHFIDFDKARIETEGGEWCEKNLQRLLRSLNKIQAQCRSESQSFHFSPLDWGNLLKGYR